MKKRGIIITTMLLLMLFCIGSIALAAEGAAEGQKVSDNVAVAIVLSAGFTIAVAVLGGATGQGKALSAALEGIARNPGASSKVMTPMIVGLALIESLVIYALVVSLMLLLKI